MLVSRAPRRRACSCCGCGVARARSRRRQGRCLTLFGRVRARGGRVASGAPALRHPGDVLGDLGGDSRLRCRACSFSCGRGCWVCSAAVPYGPRRGCTGQARPLLALTRCRYLELGHAGPATGMVHIAQEARMNAHAHYL
jgi:hypothetical protein